jgi:tRNA modification GTPase
MKKMAARIRRPLKKLIDGSRYGLILREGLKTAIAGRPNVGKSSLLNALLEHDRAIVTEMPGTTRDVIEEHLNIQGLPVRIMDTAGIRDVKNLAEKEGVKRSLRTMEDADLVLVVLDGSRALHATDRELIKKSHPENTIFVINKSDLPLKISASALNELKIGKGDMQRRTLKISAKNGTGIEKLKEKIVNTALHGTADTSAGIVTNTRHVHALEKALLSIDSFMSGVKADDSPEFLSVELRDALDSIGEILGITTPEDILDRIFSSFCIGK